MSSKREVLINTALELFYAKGINSIGINEILAKSGVAKRTLYSHFESKEALILAALNQRHLTFMGWLEDRLKSTQSNSDVINALFAALHDWFNGNQQQLGKFRGCFFVNTAAEFSDSNSQVAQYCSFHKKEVRSLIQKHLSKGSDTLLDAICIVKEGAISSVYLTGESDETTKKCIELLTSVKH